jgi:predicted nucleic acid-binding protein
VTGVVLDASAAIEITPDTSRGLRLASHLPTEGEVMAPDHFFAEVGSALRRMENHGDLSGERAALALRRVLISAGTPSEHARLAICCLGPGGNLTIGDGLYVALARILDVALVTAGDRLSRVPALGVRVVTRP